MSRLSCENYKKVVDKTMSDKIEEAAMIIENETGVYSKCAVEVAKQINQLYEPQEIIIFPDDKTHCITEKKDGVTTYKRVRPQPGQDEIERDKISKSNAIGMGLIPPDQIEALIKEMYHYLEPKMDTCERLLIKRKLDELKATHCKANPTSEVEG